jgi:hypothetical protein
MRFAPALAWQLKIQSTKQCIYYRENAENNRGLADHQVCDPHRIRARSHIVGANDVSSF